VAEASRGALRITLSRVQSAKLIYVGDPMCSWCYGFAPEVESLAEDHPVEVVVGGLRPGPAAQPLDDRLADSLRHHWDQIARRTSQPFDTSILDRRDGWLYDTEPADIAVTVMRSMRETSTLPYFADLQTAFYAHGEDITDPEVLTSLAARFDVDEDAFRVRLTGPEGKRDAWQDFAKARGWGITGFPSVIADFGNDRLALVGRGWSAAAEIRSRLEWAAVAV
jgi:putative protein-disulfide isomerase